MKEESQVAGRGPRPGSDAPPTREAAVRAELDRKGYRSLAHAARAADLDYATLAKVIRVGLSSNPRVRTVEALTKLGIVDLVRRA